MKQYSYLYKFFAAASFLLASSLISCQDELSVEQEINPGEELTLTVSLPEAINTTLTRADASDKSDITVSSLTLAQYKADGSCINAEKIAGNVNLQSGDYTLRFYPKPEAATFEVIANMTDDQISSLTASPQKKASDIIGNAQVLWGRGTNSGNTVTVSLIRNYAKISVESTVERNIFEIKAYKVYGNAINGTLAPVTAGNLNVPSGITYGNLTETGSDITNTGSICPVFETPKERNVKIIIKAKYNGKDCYYPVAFASRSYSQQNNASASPSNDNYPDETPNVSGNDYYTYSPIDIIRNHHYTLKVDYVRAEGWSSLGDALKADPDNRITCQIIDETIALTDIIACRDYMLGVDKNYIEIEGNADNIVFNVVTSYKGTSGTSDDIKFEIYELADNVRKDCEWIYNDTEDDDKKVTFGTMEGAVKIKLGGSSTNIGKGYKVTFRNELNPDDDKTRTAYIVVKAGDLERTVRIFQKERDYARDADRKVTLVNLPYISYDRVQNIDDYFNWLDNTCNGVRPEENMGAVINDGLHFPVFMDSYKTGTTPRYLSYRIPKLSNDKSATLTSGSGIFTLSTTNSAYYEITANTDKNDIAVGNFRIEVEADSKTYYINYPLYKTGWFHYLDGNGQPNVANLKKTGWYYYGVVKVSIPGRNDNMYWLDRNLGASTNAPYFSSYEDYSSDTNKKAIGAYFIIANGKMSGNPTSANDQMQDPNTYLSSLNLGGFKVPTMMQLNNLLVRTETSPSSSAAYFRGEDFTGSHRVYIPHGGYYEGSAHKNETHANLWSRTLLSGNQGFNTLSPEYKLWYLYLNVYNSISWTDNKVDNDRLISSQMRIANGSAGKEPSSQKNPVYRYMPVRLVHGDPTVSTINNTDPTAGDGTVTPPDKFTDGDKIIFKWNNKYDGIDHPYLYAWKDGGGELTGGYPGWNSNISGDTEITYSDGVQIGETISKVWVIVNNNKDYTKIRFSITPKKVTYEFNGNNDSNGRDQGKDNNTRNLDDGTHMAKSIKCAKSSDGQHYVFTVKLW